MAATHFLREPNPSLPGKPFCGECGNLWPCADAPPIKSIGDWKTNADMIVDVKSLGYLEGPVLDLTYGLGRFWSRYRPDDLTTNDLDVSRDADFAVDFTDTAACSEAFGAGHWGSVVFDGPYKYVERPTPASESDVDAAYGVDRYRSKAEVLALLKAGVVTSEALCARRGHVLVKCQDQVVSGSVAWQTFELVASAPPSLRFVDLLMFQSYRPQPSGRRQVHSRRNYSTLLIFQKS